MFVSPDTVVPEPGRVIGYNRYAYAYGNPLKYSDPTGHAGFCDGFCIEPILGGGGGALIAMAINLSAQAGPGIAQAAPIVTQFGPQLPTLADPNVEWVQANGQNAAQQGQQADAGGDTAGPGGLDPNDFNPWKWTGSNYKSGYETQYGVTRSSEYQVHHILPQRFQSTLSEAGINVHDPRWLREVRRIDPVTGIRVHQRLYTDVWERWAMELGRQPTARDIVQFARNLEGQYATEGTLFYRQGANLPSQVDWNTLSNLLSQGQ